MVGFEIVSRYRSSGGRGRKLPLDCIRIGRIDEDDTDAKTSQHALHEGTRAAVDGLGADDPITRAEQ